MDKHYNDEEAAGLRLVREFLVNYRSVLTHGDRMYGIVGANLRRIDDAMFALIFARNELDSLRSTQDVEWRIVEARIEGMREGCRIYYQHLRPVADIVIEERISELRASLAKGDGR